MKHNDLLEMAGLFKWISNSRYSQQLRLPLLMQIFLHGVGSTQLENVSLQFFFSFLPIFYWRTARSCGEPADITHGHYDGDCYAFGCRVRKFIR